MKNAFQGTISGAGYGYVYIMSYPNSDKVKIGHSLNPTTRAADIGGTLAPETPTVEAYFWCAERREAVEREAHRIAADSRHNGEWFALSIGQAMTTIQQASSRVGVSAQLAFDRNLWEQKAAEELTARTAALATMSYEDVITNYAVQYARHKAANPNGQPVFTDGYEIALMREYQKRQAVKIAAIKAKAEQEAKVRDEEAKVRDEEAKVRAEAERAAMIERAESAAEAIAQSKTMRGITKSYMSLTQIGLGFLTICFLLLGIASLIDGKPDGFWGTLSIVTIFQAVAWFDRKEKLQKQLGETA